MKHQTITIIGGGIAGLTAAIALKQVGINAVLFEASSENKAVGAGLGLGVNAMLALQAIGLAKEILIEGFPLRSFSILDQNGKQISRNTFSDVRGIGHAAIHRASLQQLLLSHVDAENIKYGKRIVEIDELSFGMWLHFEDGTRHFTNYLIVADGIHSTVRQKLQPTSTPVYAGYTCWRSIVDAQDTFATQAYETWGQNGRFGMVPLGRNKTYWFACINANANDPKYTTFTIEDLQETFHNYHAPIPAILNRSSNNKLIHNHIYDLKPLHQFAFGRMVLIGDAAHATTPNMGQGAGMAIEDAVVLAACMRRERDYEAAFQDFERKRIVRSKWVIKTSRRIGQMAQLENPLLIKCRNGLLRMLPDSMAGKNLKKLAAVSFTDLTSIHRNQVS